MLRWINEFRLKREYGQPVVVVSGLPRSGTSMMMNMLKAGGLPLLEDRLRRPDEDNPLGYFELERVKNLGKEADTRWLLEARGRAVKIISELLQTLPDSNYYRVLFMNRNMEEVIASQNKMLERSGQTADQSQAEELAALFGAHLTKIRFWLSLQPNFEVLEIDYVAVLRDSLRESRRIRRFLARPLKLEPMSAVVDPDLYRNRSQEL